jgi:phage tail sheath protein FI
VSLTITDTNFFATVLNLPVASGGSAWVDVNYWNNDGNLTITFNNGTYTVGAADSSSEIPYSGSSTIGSYNYRPGSDGIPSSGDPALFVTALSTSGALANTDYFNYHILLTPDDIEQPVQDAAIALAEYRADFMYLVDPPLGLSYSQVISWHNGQGYGRTTAVTSSYAAMYWPWLKTYDSYWARYSWCPPSVFIVGLFMQVDNLYAPWFAPAGNTRGQISASDVETTVSFAQREQLYGNFNCINPIVNFASQGLIVYGQKTGLRQNSATNRINVRRMVIYIKKLVKAALDNMLFEPNDPDSWGKATDLVNSILEPIRQGGGLSQYQVVIDATTNTANTIAQNMMNGIIKIVPVSTIEIIVMTLAIYQSGTTIT